MRNKELMTKIKELATSFGNASRIDVQIAIIRQAFGVKNDEHQKMIRDYERKVVLSDDQIREKFQERIRFYKWAVKENNRVRIHEFGNEIFYFIDAVRFFNFNLADEFELVAAQI
ncbi:hypothetical protein AAXB25_14795 [Paenibacillus lautus]|uniref:hypothetical protein n=1 Tax=Paenibacillus lautus TaxID=1401 RepID=UPI003D2C4089